MNLLRAFALITFRSLWNRLALAVRRLKKPRYLVSFLAGAGYTWFFVLRNMQHMGVTVNGTPLILRAGALGADLLSIPVLALLLFFWHDPRQSGAITLSEAEIAFLFPAPLNRGQLLLYKLFRSIPGILITSTMMMLFGLRHVHASPIGLVIVIGVLTVYSMMVAQALARLKLIGIGFWIRAVVVDATAVLIVRTIVNSLRTENLGSLLSALSAKQLSPAAIASLVATASGPFERRPLSVLLFIPKLFTHAVLPQSNLELLLSCLTLIVLGYGFYLAAARMAVSFEEASIAQAQKRLSKAGRRRNDAAPSLQFRRLPPLFKLQSLGRPEVAVIWKNVIAATRMRGLVIIIFLVIPLVNVAILFSLHNVEGAFWMLLGISALFPLIGSAIFTHDLRMDLSRAEWLKTFPLTGEQLVRAEIFAPLSLIAALEMSLLICTFLVGQLLPKGSTAAMLGNPEYLTLALLFTVPFCATQLVIRNAAPLLLPGWFQRSREDPRGFASAGTRMLGAFANILVLSVVLLPSFVLFFPALLLCEHFFHGNTFMLALAATPAIALLCVEVMAGVKLLGAQLDRFDVSNDLDLAGW